MRTQTYTSTISPTLLSWVDEEARHQKKTRRDILERALIQYKRERMKEGFQKAARDPDIIEMTEWGMDEYHSDIKNT